MDKESKNKVFEPLFRGIFERGRILDSEVPEVSNFCGIVYVRHFKYAKSYKDDLIHEGLFGILRLLDTDNPDEKSSKYNPSNSAMSFAYTKVRNCMTNFLSKKTPVSIDEYHENEDLAVSGEQYDLVLARILDFIKERFEEWKVDDTMKGYLNIYFNEKFGLKVEMVQVTDVSLDFVVRYEYFINLLESLLSDKFLAFPIFVNPVRDIIRILDGEGEISEPIRLMIQTLDPKVVNKILYILAGNTLKMPSKRKLTRTDHYLTVYKNVKNGRFSVEEAAKYYDKSVDVIEGIVTKYDKAW